MSHSFADGSQRNVFASGDRRPGVTCHITRQRDVYKRQIVAFGLDAEQDVVQSHRRVEIRGFDQDVYKRQPITLPARTLDRDMVCFFP